MSLPVSRSSRSPHVLQEGGGGGGEMGKCGERSTHQSLHALLLPLLGPHLPVVMGAYIMVLHHDHKEHNYTTTETGKQAGR